MDTYDVYLGQESVGEVDAQVEGLYYRFQCRCKLSGEVVYRLLVSCGDHQENLGVLIPVGSSFGLNTRLALKRLGKGALQFRLLPKHPDLGDRFVPLGPEEPFSYISKLRYAYLQTRNAQKAVGFRE
jgi:hypothetical protein